MEINIRLGLKQDLKSAFDLVTELAVFEKEPFAVTATLEDYIEAFESGLIQLIVAERDNKIIGMALYYLTFSTWKGKMMYLEDFYVTQDARSRGVGQMIFDKFLEESKNQGCRLAKWQVLDWNERALHFYKRNNAIIEKQWWNGKIVF